MKRMLGAASLSLLIVTCVCVQPGKAGPLDPGLYAFAAADTPSAKAKKTKRTKEKAVQSHTVTRSAYSTNPEYDVYVRGEYVGSDPDPRVRATIRQEAVRHYGMD